jgi:hypothetical protein
LYLDLAGPNATEGCVLVRTNLFATFVGGIVGQQGHIVGTGEAVSAAHDILLRLEETYGSPLEKWFGRVWGKWHKPDNANPVPK